MSNKNLWWAYLHTEGSLKVKRYFDERDLQDAEESPFVQDYCGPFEADTRDEAINIAMEEMGLERK